MGIADRIEGTIENWRTKWGGALATFLANFLVAGLTKLLDNMEVEAILEKQDQFTGVTLPPEVKEQLDALAAKKGLIHVPAFILMALGGVVGSLLGVVMGWAAPISRATGYKGDWFIQSARLDPLTAIRARWRGFISEDVLITTLREQGLSPDNIKALRDVSHYYPSPAELVLWTAREVFEPDKIAKYGLMADADKLRREDFYKAGMDDTQINNHWIAHWEHASWTQIIEMLHRGIIDEQDVKDWFPLVEVAPFWAENLIKIAYTWPTRVDVRRFWDMRTIDETRLRKLYEGMGYHGENLEDYIKWTKVYVDFPMMMTRFKNGWITEDDIREWLRGLEIPEERITQFIEEKTKPEAPARVEGERTATATEIMKAVKKGYITRSEGIDRLGRMGYSESEADFKLSVYIGVAEGSPETYMEFVELTEKYREAMGLKAEVPSPDLVAASKAVREATIALRDAESEEKTLEELAPYQKTKQDAEYHYRQLLIAWEEEKKKASG